MTIRLALGQVEDVDNTIVTFAHQLGLRSIHLQTPSALDHSRGYYDADELRALRQRCEDAGLVLEAIENVPYHFYDRIMLGQPGREHQLENFCRTIRSLAEAGIPVLGYLFLPAYIWRTGVRVPGRGGALVSAYDADRIDEGNKLAGYKLTPPAADVEPIAEEQMWDNYRVFLETVLPVAEEVGVQLAVHPDDPPTDLPLDGIARILSSPDGLERAHELSCDSPAWGLDLCLGTVSEMNGERSIHRVIDFFGPKGKISYVHFRDVDGVVPRFSETFLGAGNYDPAAVLTRLARSGFDGFVIDDHVPAMVGDADTWGATSGAYCSRGRAHAMGYLQGLMNGLGMDDPTRHGDADTSA